jgi:hypothetical protein
MTPEDFSTSYLPSTLDTLAQLTGTPAEQWKSTIAAKTAVRNLLQVNPTNVAVSLSILTRNPQLVVYRLAQAPSLVDGSGCITELCVRLVAAGVPVLTGSIQITPDYSSVFQFGRAPTEVRLGLGWQAVPACSAHTASSTTLDCCCMVWHASERARLRSLFPAVCRDC